jgi:putative ubiquitin-RnfH superfamily antitoxin RatB of RatAB toxin-antitoxin module
MQVGVAYAEAEQQLWLQVDVPEDCTVRDAIERSGILKRFPHLDLETNKVGIFGKLAKLDASIQAGDRIEIYRAITADPKTVKRRDRDESEEDDD